MWTAWLAGLDSSVEVGLADPVDGSALAAAERALGVALPPDLRSLLAESDGLVDGSGVEPVWPAERIAEENLDRRADPGPPPGPGPGLLLFGETGTGEYFAYRGPRAEDDEPDIYLWHELTGSTRWIASDLQTMLDGWWSRELDL